jgi:hypothetical protein
VICFSIAQVALTKTTWSRKLKIFTIWLSTERVSWLPVTLLKKQNQHKLYIYIYINEKRCSRNHTDLNSAPNPKWKPFTWFYWAPNEKGIGALGRKEHKKERRKILGSSRVCTGHPWTSHSQISLSLNPITYFGVGESPRPQSAQAFWKVCPLFCTLCLRKKKINQKIQTKVL